MDHNLEAADGSALLLGPVSLRGGGLVEIPTSRKEREKWGTRAEGSVPFEFSILQF